MDHEFLLQWFPMWIAQVMRGVCIFVGPFCIFLSALHIFKTASNRSQRFRFAALSLLLMAVVYMEAERWEEPVTPRLFLATAGIAFAFAGLWKLRKDDV